MIKWTRDQSLNVEALKERVNSRREVPSLEMSDVDSQPLPGVYSVPNQILPESVQIDTTCLVHFFTPPNSTWIDRAGQDGGSKFGYKSDSHLRALH